MSTLPLGLVERGRWSTEYQWPELWSRAATACKRFSSWREPHSPRPVNTEISLSHTGNHTPKLANQPKRERERENKEKKGRKEEIIFELISRIINTRWKVDIHNLNCEIYSLREFCGPLKYQINSCNHNECLTFEGNMQISFINCIYSRSHVHLYN